ncbi:diguanylate cyclase (GGDEF) domain-containing protein [Lachnospiraceae bacterium G11]|nr:diguanylate cyclase (GGDEF) domain-containing protein [Lachnospiraceae bacterium G11]
MFFLKKRLTIKASIKSYNLMCLLIHIWLLIFFSYLGIVPLAIINIFSIVAYAVPLFLKGEDGLYTGLFIMFIELGLYGAISTVILGIACGFYTYNIPIPLSSFIELDTLKRKRVIFYGSTTSILLAIPLSYLLSDYFEHYRALMIPYNESFLICNLIVVILSIAISVPVFMLQTERKSAEIKYESEHDTLTGVYNRHFFHQFIDNASQKDEIGGSVIMFDIDNFKGINDEYGHDIGDIALQKVTSLSKDKISDKDILVRWGGEEFVIYTPGQNLEDAARKAEEIRKLIEQTPYHDNKYLTVTLGVTQFNKDERFEHVLTRADNNLYSGKESGKNKVVAC